MRTPAETEAIRAAFAAGTTPEQRETISRWVRRAVADATNDDLENLLDDLIRPSTYGHQLSHREQQILALHAGGYEGPDIAQVLGISPETVATHRKRAKAKLGARTITQAVVLWLSG